MENRDQILELFKKSVEEDPRGVESVFEGLLKSKISNLISSRKIQVSESILSDKELPNLGDDDLDLEDDDFVFDDETDDDDSTDKEDDEGVKLND